MSNLYDEASGIVPNGTVRHEEVMPEYALRDKYDFMRLSGNVISDEEERSRFLDPVSICFACAYKCPCEMNGGSKCMDICHARGKSMIENSRSFFLNMGSKRERKDWLIDIVKYGSRVKIDEMTGEATFLRQNSSARHPGSRPKSIKFWVNGNEVCESTFQNVYAIRQHSIGAARKAFLESMSKKSLNEAKARMPSLEADILIYLTCDEHRTSFMAAWFEHQARTCAHAMQMPRMDSGETADSIIYKFFEGDYKQIYQSYVTLCETCFEMPFCYAEFRQTWKIHPSFRNMK